MKQTSAAYAGYQEVFKQVLCTRGNTVLAFLDKFSFMVSQVMKHGSQFFGMTKFHGFSMIFPGF